MCKYSSTIHLFHEVWGGDFSKRMPSILLKSSGMLLASALCFSAPKASMGAQLRAVSCTQVIKKGAALSCSGNKESLQEARGLGKIRGEGMAACSPGSGIWAAESLFSS